jgi:hypothetical protein
MLPAPDAKRQRCINLSPVIHSGNRMLATFQKRLRHWEKIRDEDFLATCEQEFWTWQERVLAVLEASEQAHFQRIADTPQDPSIQQAWDGVVGRGSADWLDQHRNLIDPVSDVLLPTFYEQLDFVKALRVRLFPPLVIPEHLQFTIADRLKDSATLDTITELFLRNGCLIDWWIPPRKPQRSERVTEVLGWFDGLTLYVPEDVVSIIQAVYADIRRHKNMPQDVGRDAIQVALDALQPPTTTVTLTPYSLYQTVDQVATPYMQIGQYDAALLHVCIALNNAVQTRSQRPDLDGVPLMRTVFSAKSPILNIEARYGNQQGFMDLFAGVMDAIRNPRAHHAMAGITAAEAIEWLAFLSALFRVLDTTTP